MASIAISASIHRVCSANHHVSRKQQPQVKQGRSFGAKQAAMQVVTADPEKQRGLNMASTQLTMNPDSAIDRLPKGDNDKEEIGPDGESSCVKFQDERWKNGTWDLNMFVKDGRMDWDAVIDAEARRRRFLELYPEEATNQDPVVFRSSIIPWWSWIRKSHLPEAELLNGRAAMVGFFMSYFVDALTGLDVVGQTGNFLCKAGLFVTIIGVMLFRRKKDLENLRQLADEATFYDKQWQASHIQQDQKDSS